MKKCKTCGRIEGHHFYKDSEICEKFSPEDEFAKFIVGTDDWILKEIDKIISFIYTPRSIKKTRTRVMKLIQEVLENEK